MPNQKILFKEGDTRIRTYKHGGDLLVEVDVYYTLKGFFGDEDYYQHYIYVKNDDIPNLLNLLKNETQNNDILECISDKFSNDSADIDLAEYCLKNNIAFHYYDRIEGATYSNDKSKIAEKINYLRKMLEERRLKKYKR